MYLSSSHDIDESQLKSSKSQFNPLSVSHFEEHHFESDFEKLADQTRGISRDIYRRVKKVSLKKPWENWVREAESKLSHFKDYDLFISDMMRFYQHKMSSRVTPAGKLHGGCVKVNGLSSGDFRVASCFKNRPVTRSFEDLEWTLRTFQAENPRMSLLGQSLKKFYLSDGRIQLGQEERLIQLLLHLLRNPAGQPERDNISRLDQTCKSRSSYSQRPSRTHSRGVDWPADERLVKDQPERR